MLDSGPRLVAFVVSLTPIVVIGIVGWGRGGLSGSARAHVPLVCWLPLVNRALRSAKTRGGGDSPFRRAVGGAVSWGPEDRNDDLKHSQSAALTGVVISRPFGTLWAANGKFREGKPKDSFVFDMGRVAPAVEDPPPSSAASTFSELLGA